MKSKLKIFLYMVSELAVVASLSFFVSPLAKATIIERKVINNYQEVVDSLRRLIDVEGIAPEEILVVSDWDEVIDRGELECPKTRARYLKEIKKLGARFMVLTSRASGEDAGIYIFPRLQRTMSNEIGFNLESFDTFHSNKSLNDYIPNFLRHFGSSRPPSIPTINFEVPTRSSASLFFTSPWVVRVLKGYAFSYFKPEAIAALIDQGKLKTIPKAIIFVDDNEVEFIDPFLPVFENRSEKVVLLHYPVVGGQQLGPLLIAAINREEDEVNASLRKNFVRIDDPVFGPNSALSPSGLIWSDERKIPVKNRKYFSPRTESKFDQRIQREAFDACLNLNPREERLAIRRSLAAGERPVRGIFLPRKLDWEEVRIWDLPNLRLGISDGDNDSWTSTVSPNDTNKAYLYSRSSDLHETPRARLANYRCVRVAEDEPQSRSNGSVVSAGISHIPVDIGISVFSYLSMKKLHEIYDTTKSSYLKCLAELNLKKEIRRYLGKFTLLPEVTARDVENLEREGQSGIDISEGMSVVSIAQSEISAGLYRAVMGHFPFKGPISLWETEPNRLIRDFVKFEELNALVNKLNQITGRSFRMSALQQGFRLEELREVTEEQGVMLLDSGKIEIIQ